MALAKLDTSFINHFLTSVETTFIKVFRCEVTRGEFCFSRNQSSEPKVVILTGVIGNCHSGMVVYRMNDTTAQRMIDFLDPTDKDSTDRYLIYEGLGEVINIISGNTMTHFSKNDILIDITTPSIIAGSTFELYLLNQTTLSADMLSPFGIIEIDIAIKHFKSNM